MAYGRSWERYESGYGRWAPYVSVSERRKQAAAAAKRLAKRHGRALQPVTLAGRTIARTFWGKAWCDNLEAYSDFSNRLPRGRTYVRNGSVIDLHIDRRRITAYVSGSEIYEIDIQIKRLAAKSWLGIQRDCARSISSLIDLLQGRFDRGVMERLSRAGDGLFPRPQEITMNCSCPDYAGLCKHLAAVLYAVGARLDESPELLFTLRDVDHLDLIGQASAADNLDRALAGSAAGDLQAGDLGELFGIELETPNSVAAPLKARPRRPSARTPARNATKRPAAASSQQPAQPRSPGKRASQKTAARRPANGKVTRKGAKDRQPAAPRRRKK